LRSIFHLGILFQQSNKASKHQSIKELHGIIVIVVVIFHLTLTIHLAIVVHLAIIVIIATAKNITLRY
jgi:hypothetical protein